MKNSSYYIAPVGVRTHDLPHAVASNMGKVSHALTHSATAAVLGDKDLLHMIRGSDNKCSDMMVDYFQYHMVCMNSYLTRLGHPQEKACDVKVPPHVHGDDVMAQLISCLDDSLFRDGAIFFVTFLRNEFRKSPETHGVDNGIKLVTVLR